MAPNCFIFRVFVVLMFIQFLHEFYHSNPSFLGVNMHLWQIKFTTVELFQVFNLFLFCVFRRQMTDTEKQLPYSIDKTNLYHAHIFWLSNLIPSSERIRVCKSCKDSICQLLLMWAWRICLQLPAPGSLGDVWSRPLSFRIMRPHSFHKAIVLSHNSYHFNNRVAAMNGILILFAKKILFGFNIDQ